MKEIIYLDGKFVRAQEAKISALAPGFLQGMGVFETMRAYNKKIIGLDYHLKRIKSGCAFIGIKIPYPADKLKKIIYQALDLSVYADNYIKLAVWKELEGTGVLIFVKEYQPYSAQKYRIGFRAGVSSLRQSEANLFAAVKTTNRLLYELSFQQAKQKGFDEAIILNDRGYITEASRSNIFFAKDNELFTPSLDCGCLEGITRKIIFEQAKKHKINICEGKFTLFDLYKADEAFLANSLIGVMPLAGVENKLINNGNRGKLTNLFIAGYKF
ncbi:MAG: aminotransferase class IV [Candidatus Omnitrophota bacterium]